MDCEGITASKAICSTASTSQACRVPKLFISALIWGIASKCEWWGNSLEWEHRCSYHPSNKYSIDTNSNFLAPTKKTVTLVKPFGRKFVFVENCKKKINLLKTAKSLFPIVTNVWVNKEALVYYWIND